MSLWKSSNPETNVSRHLSDQELIDMIELGQINKAILHMKALFWMQCGWERKYKVEEDEYLTAFWDVVLILIKQLKAGNYKRQGTLKAYFCSILRNKVIDILNKKKTNRETVELNEEIEAPHEEIEAPIIKGDYDAKHESVEDQRALLKGAMEILSKQHKRCWILLDGRLSGLSWKEIAEESKYTVKAARQTFSSTCKKKLHKILIDLGLQKLAPEGKDILILYMSGHNFAEIGKLQKRNPEEVERLYLYHYAKLAEFLGRGALWNSLKKLNNH